MLNFPINQNVDAKRLSDRLKANIFEHLICIQQNNCRVFWNLYGCSDYSIWRQLINTVAAHRHHRRLAVASAKTIAKWVVEQSEATRLICG